jgi:hypothetical protein
MKEVVVTDPAAGKAGMTLVERLEPHAAINGTSDEHRERRNPRRRRPRLEPDRAYQREDDHSHSPVRTCVAKSKSGGAR